MTRVPPSPKSQLLARRRFLEGAAAASAIAVLSGTAAACRAGGVFSGPAASSAKGFELPDLPYAHDALEPVINTRTMELHHGKHHAGYVKKLNAALEAHPELLAKSPDDLVRELDQLPEAVRGAVRNHGGGHSNHAMFWTVMGPERGSEPGGELGEAIASVFGDVARFREAFNAAGGSRFGSGWVWLTVNPEGRLEVLSTPNQDSPLSAGHEVVLGNDVWEHAYYLTYENRRSEYLQAWWRLVDWEVVGRRFADAMQRRA